MSAFNYQRKELGDFTSHERRMLRNYQEGGATARDMRQTLTRPIVSGHDGTNQSLQELLNRLRDGRTTSPF